MSSFTLPRPAWLAVPVLAAGVLALGGASAFAADSAPVYSVTSEGMTTDQGAKLAGSFGIPNSVQGDGSFTYVAPNADQPPSKRVGEGKDEAGRPVVSEALDLDALKSLRPLSDASALKLGSKLISRASLSPDLRATPSVSHTQLTLSDSDSRASTDYDLDTTVSYALTLGGLPVTGEGAKLRVAFSGDGSVMQLSQTLRGLQRGRSLPIISSDEAVEQCAALYAADVKQDAPTLGYALPALTATDASGKGTVQTIFPSYTCNPSSGQGTQANLQLPAVQGVAPSAVLRATMRAGNVAGAATVSGGTAPYTYAWSSSTAVIDPSQHEPKIAYAAAPRDGTGGAETLTLTVTDANGISSTASAAFAGDGSVWVASHPGGGGFGKLAIGPTDVGIENMVDEWQCAQDSANGFHGVMAAHGVGVAFDFRGTNAWEEDFKTVPQGGTDTTFADNVDAQWYTGHGWPGGFTFKNAAHDDDAIVPGDADWGNGDLEWMQLESCQVLEDTNGKHDYFSRWGGTIDGLHMLNGFDTTATCVGGGTGASFANYLFPIAVGPFVLRPALTVRQAWGQMAIDREPSGTKYRSMGNIGPGGVTNINDHFWGQGVTGPDISKASRTGMWAISGTV